MSRLHNIQDKIFKLTTLIETEYPELYKFLEETPITLPSDNHPEITTKVMENYLESLEQLLNHHIETHNKK